MPSIEKAMNIVFSRPIRSEIQPKSGREMPFMMRSSIRAKGSAAMAKKYRFTWKFFTPRSVAMTPSWATAIRPPVTVQVNMSSMT
ncbi:hypothetical protein CHKEEEPN_4594 [Methylorubrum podarium]|nr:hypothetical protein CHKEEEPN_4594 [Methylorubrum podarium]